MNMLPRGAARELLEASGYVVVIRTAGWTECLVHREGERWDGRGLDEDEAIADVLHKMLPSRLARRLAEEGTVTSALTSHVATEAPAAPGAPATDVRIQTTGGLACEGVRPTKLDGEDRVDVRQIGLTSPAVKDASEATAGAPLRPDPGAQARFVELVDRRVSELRAKGRKT
jgi:hypothetical protein